MDGSATIERERMLETFGTESAVGTLIGRLHGAPGVDQRWLNIAITDLEKGFMALRRAVNNQPSLIHGAWPRPDQGESPPRVDDLLASSAGNFMPHIGGVTGVGNIARIDASRMSQAEVPLTPNQQAFLRYAGMRQAPNGMLERDVEQMTQQGPFSAPTALTPDQEDVLRQGAIGLELGRTSSDDPPEGDFFLNWVGATFNLLRVGDETHGTVDMGLPPEKAFARAARLNDRGRMLRSESIHAAVLDFSENLRSPRYRIMRLADHGPQSIGERYPSPEEAVQRCRMLNRAAGAGG